MTNRQKHRVPVLRDGKTVPFDTVEEAWFWFVAAQQARVDGARITAGQALVERPCEPLDILRILDSLYRQRTLTMDHLMVLRFYGRRNMAPDPRRVKEARASALWRQAMDRLESVFESKGILRPDSWLVRFDPERLEPRPQTRFTPQQRTIWEGVAAE